MQFMIVALMLLLSGCSGLTELNSLRQFEGSAHPLAKRADFDRSKLIYDEKSRSYRYDGKVLITATGEKIKEEQEAVKSVTLLTGDDNYTKTDTAVAVGLIAYAVPVTLLFLPQHIIVGVLALPVYFSEYYYLNRYKRISFGYYKSGINAYKANQYIESRDLLTKAIYTVPQLIQGSDICFWIAKTYEQQNDLVQAKSYFSKFVNYSIQQYPDYFPERDSSFSNDFTVLGKEFDEAESKLK
jgi:hypothetical protein